MRWTSQNFTGLTTCNYDAARRALTASLGAPRLRQLFPNIGVRIGALCRPRGSPDFTLALTCLEDLWVFAGDPQEVGGITKIMFYNVLHGNPSCGVIGFNTVPFEQQDPA